MSDGLKYKLRKMDVFLASQGGKAYEVTLGKLKYALRHSASFQNVVVSERKFEDICWKYDKKRTDSSEPLVSVIVPNYNHEPYLRERLDSIYAQTYKNFEVILLDDCSTDNSRKILLEYAKKNAGNTRVLFNDCNSGHVFKQWNKGIKAAKGVLIWIAESDDYCDPNFLQEMVGMFEFDSVKLSFARSDFMQEGQKIWCTEEYLHDLKIFKWNKPFYMTAHNMVKHGFAIHNMIPNVSSAVFRNIGQIPQMVEQVCSEMHLSGDWIFYLTIMKGGVVGYTNRTTNYYRIHSKSTSLKVQKEADYYLEFEKVSKFIAENYNVKKDVFNIILSNLKQHYCVTNDVGNGDIVENYYHVKEILERSKYRKPNILMTCYSMKSGGGETYPIYLANEMHRQGLAVTLLNFDIEERETRIEELINPGLPVVNIKSLDYFKHIVVHLGGEVIHSHHASVDEAVAQWLSHNEGLGAHVITLHGMYEAIEDKDCTRVIEKTWESCYKYIYIADKNLKCFVDRRYPIDSGRFIKMPNGLPVMNYSPVERSTLGIEEDSFVLTIVSRGLPEKGWKEGIEAVVRARKQSSRPIHLVILGDGDVRKALEETAPEYVHFMGTQSNVRDYFAMSDAGLLPSYFKGESYPLVVIECLMVGKPVIATDIAEVRNQLSAEDGQLAGILLQLSNWKLDTDEMVGAILEMAGNNEKYNLFKSRTFSAAKKFDIVNIAKQYVSIYCEAVNSDSKL